LEEDFNQLATGFQHRHEKAEKLKKTRQLLDDLQTGTRHRLNSEDSDITLDTNGPRPRFGQPDSTQQLLREFTNLQKIQQRNVTLDKIPSIQGTEGYSNLEYFFNQLGLYTEGFKPRERVDILRMKCTGRAANTFELACQEHGTSNFFAIIRYMKSRLITTSSIAVSSMLDLQNGMTRRRDKNGKMEYWDKFCYRVFDKVKSAFPNFDAKTLDEYATRYLLHTCLGHDLMATEIRATIKGCKSFDDVVTEICTIASTYRETKRRMQDPQYSNYDRRNRTPSADANRTPRNDYSQSPRAGYSKSPRMNYQPDNNYTRQNRYSYSNANRNVLSASHPNLNANRPISPSTNYNPNYNSNSNTNR
ncbi:MAG TPA: hypothetical protein VFV08_04680, partial [Puia sp.]|nr:hypothetical protein [Puia sp.]